MLVLDVEGIDARRKMTPKLACGSLSDGARLRILCVVIVH
jgi:hypothetical protein